MERATLTTTNNHQQMLNWSCGFTCPHSKINWCDNQKCVWRSNQKIFHSTQDCASICWAYLLELLEDFTAPQDSSLMLLFPPSVELERGGPEGSILVLAPPCDSCRRGWGAEKAESADSGRTVGGNSPAATPPMAPPPRPAPALATEYVGPMSVMLVK